MRVFSLSWVYYSICYLLKIPTERSLLVTDDRSGLFKGHLFIEITLFSKNLVTNFYRVCCCVFCCTVLLKVGPSFFFIKQHIEILKNLLVYSLFTDCSKKIGLTTRCWDSTLDTDFKGVKRCFFKNMWISCWPYPIILWIYITQQVQPRLIGKKNRWHLINISTLFKKPLQYYVQAV